MTAIREALEHILETADAEPLDGAEAWERFTAALDAGRTALANSPPSGEERGSIVAWLRGEAYGSRKDGEGEAADWAHALANRIERGDHLPPTGGG